MIFMTNLFNEKNIFLQIDAIFVKINFSELKLSFNSPVKLGKRMELIPRKLKFDTDLVHTLLQLTY